MRASSLVSGGTSGDHVSLFYASDCYKSLQPWWQLQPSSNGSTQQQSLPTAVQPLWAPPKLVGVRHPSITVIHTSQRPAAVGSLQHSCHSPCSSCCPGLHSTGLIFVC